MSGNKVRRSFRLWCGYPLAAAAVLLLTTLTVAQDSVSPSDSVRPSDSSSARQRRLSEADLVAAQKMGQSLGIADWLGPLAPVGLSPFFGITCLSGMALYGRGWVSADNPFLGEGSPVADPTVFTVFLILTLVTSIPRLTKVSKPFAQAVDQVEAWAGIITLLALRVLMTSDTNADVAVPAATLGLVSFTADTLLMIAAAINVFVINTVKFFFEILIWVTPVPALDALFEVANKTVCAGLMAVYGFSPAAATGINLLMFGAALIVFRWVYRREVFFRTLLLDAVTNLIRPRKRLPRSGLTVFPASEIGPFPPRTRCVLKRTATGWSLTRNRLFRGDVVMELNEDDCSPEIVKGYFCNCLRLTGNPSGDLSFSRCCNHTLPELAAELNATLQEHAATACDRSLLRTELA
ncbi:MAG: hypothetical protein KDA89_07985 [Planctomycetaceae bacterium]|nr:hypothetical protein [Planctomycetaceae bacterium]